MHNPTDWALDVHAGTTMKARTEGVDLLVEALAHQDR